MTIAPIVHTVEVKAPPPRAFELFASRIGDWWPKGNGIGKNPLVTVTIEPQAGGLWYERDADGNDTLWGKVLAWEPPERLLLAWQLTPEWKHDPDLLTEVELTFAPNASGGTMVRLEHRHLERFGPLGEVHSEKLRGGWATKVVQYGDFADAQI
jgi:uncharacterized protein YndB with AHSA1/START domain